MKTIIYIPILLALFALSCNSSKLPEIEQADTITSNPEGSGQELSIEFLRGEKHNHPLMAIWIESYEGEYIQTLYVAESLASGTFDHGEAKEGKWVPASQRRPAALPVWSHSRHIEEKDGYFVPTPDHAIPDAYSGATPTASFLLNTRLDNNDLTKFELYFEINQTWDWNEYWTNNKYPDDENYKTSCQPSLIYSARIDLNDEILQTELTLKGRGHHSGADGEIYTDHKETMTTALDITRKISVLEKK